MARYEQAAERIMSASVAAVESVHRELPAVAAEVAAAILLAFRSGGKVLFCGNGGSAADAQHLAAELAGRLKLDRPGLPALALTVNASVLTAVANDFGYDEVFARLVEAHGKEGDLLVAISTSGKSANVVKAVEVAARHGITTVGLLGMGGGELGQRVEIPIVVPHARSTDRIQEVHIKVLHAVIEAVERRLFPDNYA